MEMLPSIDIIIGIMIGIIIAIIIGVVNIFLIVNRAAKMDVKPLLNDALNQFGESIKNELQRNRAEASASAESNRIELSRSFNTQNKLQIEFNAQINNELKAQKLASSKSLISFEEKFSVNIDRLNNLLNNLLREKFNDQESRQEKANQQAVNSIKQIEQTIEKQLKEIREDNSKQLGEMRKTVDEKLQNTLEKRLGESFKQVSERLELVHKGLGEMQTVASGVGDLKKVLANVKTRGTLGEYQLEGILEQILTVDQYEKNATIKKGSVEFAIKLPGKEADKNILIPVDSKFPMEDYNRLLDAFELGDKAQIESCQKALIKTVEKVAKEISDKYIDPPHTTDFAIMFLPAEGLYAEILRHPALFETLQKKYKITITGPTTLSAFLSSLQMGFRTLAVQKRSSEVWDILKSVKSEFETFSGVFEKVQKQLITASGTLETLRTTRANVMKRKLKEVETLTAIDSEKISPLPIVDDEMK